MLPNDTNRFWALTDMQAVALTIHPEARSLKVDGMTTVAFAILNRHNLL